jgi:hypothetical protein
MATFDQVISEYYIDKFYGYQGNPPTNAEEYAALNCWKEGTTNPPTWAQIQEKMALVSVQQQRAKAYPTIQQQLDMQYWDSVNGTTTWQDAIEAVKQEYPKP